MSAVRELTVRTGGDAEPVLETTEHDLDAVAALVASPVVEDGLSAGLPARDARPYPLVFQRTGCGRRLRPPEGHAWPGSRSGLRCGRVRRSRRRRRRRSKAPLRGAAQVRGLRAGSGRCGPSAAPRVGRRRARPAPARGCAWGCSRAVGAGPACATPAMADAAAWGSPERDLGRFRSWG